MLNLQKISSHQPTIIDHGLLQGSAVLLPIVHYKGRECILFEIRSQDLNFQPGEICFPGGKIEYQDKNEQAAAIRETCEELGITEENIEIIGPLDLLITPFQTIITPFVAKILDYTQIVPNKSEVQQIFYVPIDFFINNKPQTYYNKVIIDPAPDFPYHLLPNGKTYNWRKGIYPVHFYIYEGKVIWGITARIVHHFINLLNS